MNLFVIISPVLAEVYKKEWLRLANEPKVGTEKIMRVDGALAILNEFGIYGNGRVS